MDKIIPFLRICKGIKVIENSDVYRKKVISKIIFINISSKIRSDIIISVNDFRCFFLNKFNTNIIFPKKPSG